MDLEHRHIQQAIDGNAASFAWLVSQYKDLAFAIAIRILENEQEAEACYRGLTQQDQTKYINLALEKLEPEDRIMLTLYYLEEQSLGEIAVITGIHKDNVKMKLHRARRKMYGVLSKLLGIELNRIRHDG